MSVSGELTVGVVQSRKGTLEYFKNPDSLTSLVLKITNEFGFEKKHFHYENAMRVVYAFRFGASFSNENPSKLAAKIFPTVLRETFDGTVKTANL